MKRGVKRRVLVVTGSRSEFGLLRPVMAAVQKRKGLELLVVVAGEHLLKPALTWKEVAREFRIDARVGMQRAGDQGRMDHAAACARGMEGFAKAFKKLKPDWVVVLGDRIEAFAAASAASIGGVAVCHIHGGDRAEGIADEAMRHAITKLSHLHCAATEGSAARIVGMGEDKKNVFVTGSPAIDGLDKVKGLSDREMVRLGHAKTTMVVLLHPSGMDDFCESMIAFSVAMHGSVQRAIFLRPNRDPGHEVIERKYAQRRGMMKITGSKVVDHLPRATFLRLLKRLAETEGGCLMGNSSAGIIEASWFGLPTINVGPRQDGRERGGNVIDVRCDPKKAVAYEQMAGAIDRVYRWRPKASRLYGDGQAGERIAGLLAKVEPGRLLRKRNAY